MTESFLFHESQLIEVGLNNAQPEEVPPPAFVPPCISIDVSHLFTTDQIFPTRDDLINWVHGIAIENGYVVLITKSDSGGNGSRKAYVMLGCEKHGKYVPYRDPDLVERYVDPISVSWCVPYVTRLHRFTSELEAWFVTFGVPLSHQSYVDITTD
ncbi:uncharacterized protein LOC130746900 [Lotus japonicus]|uniref:uncharacterized protein LOC130746900 n=1 Tax=Lotus japonicus TaxID=34305 RepID=UPI002587859D|nr:uncharacterized protein LOC130746900 [Lotus japonicus]